MTEKQKNIINEMRAKNALFADVMYSYKDCPEEVLEGTIKLKLYDENDPVDTESDEYVFYYFDGIDEMISAMDSSNNDFEFTILSIHSFLAAGTPTDSNGFEIKRGDYVFYLSDDDSFVGVGIVVGDPSDEEILIKLEGSEDIIEYDPSRCEINYECIAVKVSNIEWDTEDGLEDTTEEELGLPKEVNIPFDVLVDVYNLENFGSELEVQQVISEYLTDEYQFCVNGYSYEFDHNRLLDFQGTVTNPSNKVYIIIHEYMSQDHQGCSVLEVKTNEEEALERVKEFAHNEIKESSYDESEIFYHDNGYFQEINYSDGYYDLFKIEVQEVK